MSKGTVERGVTLPLGPFALADDKGFDADRLRAVIAKRLKPVEDYAADTLFAVGGAGAPWPRRIWPSATIRCASCINTRSGRTNCWGRRS